MDKRDVISRYLKILSDNNTIVLTTKDEKGNPWSAKVYYGDRDGLIYVILDASSHTLRNLKENPNVFFVVEKGDPIRFLQGRGIAEILGSIEEHPDERTIVVRKNFPLIPFLKSHPDAVVVRIKPTRVWITDHSDGFKPPMELEFDQEVWNSIPQLAPRPSRLKLYIQATRPWVIGITLWAVIIGTLMAPMVDIWKFLLALTGAVLAHLGVNAWSDYFDFKKGADRWDTLGSSRTIVDKLLSPREVLSIGILLLLIAAFIGLILYFLSGSGILWLILVGALLGLFYAFVPIGWKYLALGDIAVFLAWSLMAVGAYYVQTGQFSWKPFLAFMPVALLVVGILHGNNMRDMQDDIRAGYRTVATLLGLKGSQYYYAFLIGASYLSLIALVIAGVLPVWTLIALATLPDALRNLKWAFRPNFVQFGMLDLFTARLANRMAALIALGIVMDRILSGKAPGRS